MRRRRRGGAPIEALIEQVVGRLPAEAHAFHLLGGRLELCWVVRVYRGEKRNTITIYVRVPGHEWRKYRRTYIRGTVPRRIAKVSKELNWTYVVTKAVSGDAAVKLPE